MKLAIALHAHKDAELVKDTARFLARWGSENILVVVDGRSPKWITESNFPFPHIVGFRNKTRSVFRNHSSYRNFTLGLLKTLEYYPDCDWYCSTEYDVIFGSDEFKEDILALSDNVYCVGFNGRKTFMSLPFLEHIIGSKCYVQTYLIGCCMFFRREFLLKVKYSGLFERVLGFTNEFDDGRFPGYWEQGGYDFTECLFPTLVNFFGGEIASFSSWNAKKKIWTGDFKKYPIRWPTKLSIEDSLVASIMHPVKEFEDPVRIYHRERIT